MLIIEKIRRVYDNQRGLHEFSLEASPGDAVSLVGPNGSGKSTALNIIAGISFSAGGFCTIDGTDTHRPEAKRKIGYLEEDAFYYDRISIMDFLNFIWSFKYPGTANDDLFRLLDIFALTDLRDAKLGSLSMGLRKRVGLVSALMNRPPLVVLDEPTNSVDTEGLIALKEELLALRAAGTCVILSGHVLDFLKTVSGKVVFLKDGRIAHEMNNERDTDLDAVYRTIYRSNSSGEQ
jgi:ABC-2 type transport system ATP-binding protein